MKRRMIDTEGYHFIEETYTSTLELAQTLRTRGVVDHTDPVSERLKTPSAHDREWYGVCSYEEAVKYLTEGESRKLKEVSLGINRLKPRGGMTRRTCNDIVGYMPNIPNTLRNLPDSMMNQKMVPKKTKIIHVYYGINVICDVTPQEIMDRACKLMATMMDLERRGYRFEVTVVSMEMDQSDPYADCLKLKLKRADQPFNVLKMIYPLTHPAMLRVISFDWHDKLPGARHCYGHGIGLQYVSASKRKKAWKEFGLDNKDTIYLDYYTDLEELKSLCS